MTALVAALVVVLVGGCITVTRVPVGSPADSPAAGVTPPIVNGHADESALTPPILDEGNVPAPADPTTPITGHLQLGPVTNVATQTIGSAGGTIEANGLRLQVPDGALDAATPFSVTQAPISAADFGGLVTPLTPLYAVDNGDAALSEVVTVTLSTTVPDGAVALAFYYDDATGTLSPLSPLGEDATSITAGATHFSSFFGGLVDMAKLDPIVDSGFRPGVDDWQFTNRGSYVAFGGHCLGQSMSAAWYYVNQRRAAHASSLYGLFDNNGASTKTPALDQDDSQGYRLASTFQVEAGSLPWLDSIYAAQGAIAKADDAYTYAAFKVAIAFSGEPQVIGMRHQARAGGHAMIVYRVTPEWLIIADPNYPAQYRAIRYDAATGFGSYLSGANAAEIATKGPTSYTKFAFLPWRGDSTIEAALAKDWADFENNKAGDAVFPKYALEALAGTDAAGTETWVPLVDGYTSQEKQLKIRLRDPTNANDVTMRVYDGTSTTVLGAWNAVQTINLKDGDTPLGIAIYFSKPQWSAWGYVDFVRLNVVRGSQGGWRLSGGGMEVARHGPTAPGYSWAVTASAGSITSTVTPPTPITHPVTVSIGWTVPTTLIPFADRGPSSVPGDGYLLINPVIGFGASSPLGESSNSVASVSASLWVLDHQPAPGLVGTATGAMLMADGSVVESGPQDVQVPSYTPGTRMWLEVQVNHEGAEIIYQYAYDWTGQP